MIEIPPGLQYHILWARNFYDLREQVNQWIASGRWIPIGGVVEDVDGEWFQALTRRMHHSPYAVAGWHVEWVSGSVDFQVSFPIRNPISVGDEITTNGQLFAKVQKTAWCIDQEFLEVKCEDLVFELEDYYDMEDERFAGWSAVRFGRST